MPLHAACCCFRFVMPCLRHFFDAVVFFAAASHADFFVAAAAFDFRRRRFFFFAIFVFIFQPLDAGVRFFFLFMHAITPLRC